MQHEVYLKGKRVRIDPTTSIGKGGEADVFNIGNGEALKIFKPPNHPDYQGMPNEQRGAQFRIKEQQQKLPAFPNGMPNNVIVPIDLAKNKQGDIIGYTMRLVPNCEKLLSYSERAFREGKVSNQTVVEIFLKLHEVVKAIHENQVVIGDFNDLNVLVRNIEPYIIDADSMQFAGFRCIMFTAQFVDPLLCDPNVSNPMLVIPHNANSDWFSFCTMLMQSLLYTGPYGGVFKPKDHSKKVPHPARRMKRITVFDSEVVYPKPATPFGVLPDELLHHFHSVFGKDDLRGEFPLALLSKLQWTKCLTCGTEHARTRCPECSAVGVVKEVTTVRGNVTATRLFETKLGVILSATVQNGELKFLFHEGTSFKRDVSNTKVFEGTLDAHMRFGIQGNTTMIAMKGKMIVFEPNKPHVSDGVDSYMNVAIFAANSTHRYWACGGRLFRDASFAPEYIGDVLSGQTIFWAGEKFGFGLYRAGEISVSFTFDAQIRGINDNFKIPAIRGQLIDAVTYFSDHRAWFFVTTQQGSVKMNQCTVLKKDGTIIGYAQAQAGDDTDERSWLATIKGKCAAGDFLLSTTDEGIVRVEIDGAGGLVKTKEFPDTEPYVHTECTLLAGKQGLYVVTQKQITLLQIR